MTAAVLPASLGRQLDILDVAAVSAYLDSLAPGAKDELGALLRAQAAVARRPLPEPPVAAAFSAVHLPVAARCHPSAELAGQLRFVARSLVRGGWLPERVRLTLEPFGDDLPPGLVDQAIDFGIAEGHDIHTRNLVAEEVAELVRPTGTAA